MKTLSFLFVLSELLLLWFVSLVWGRRADCQDGRRCSSVRRLLCSASHRYLLPNRHQVRAACRRRCGFRNGANKPSAPLHCSSTCTGAKQLQILFLCFKVTKAPCELTTVCIWEPGWADLVQHYLATGYDGGYGHDVVLLLHPYNQPDFTSVSHMIGWGNNGFTWNFGWLC